MVEVLQGKMCQNSLPSGGGRSIGAKFSGGRDRPWGIFFWFLQEKPAATTSNAEESTPTTSSASAAVMFGQPRARKQGAVIV